MDVVGSPVIPEAPSHINTLYSQMYWNKELSVNRTANNSNIFLKTPDMSEFTLQNTPVVTKPLGLKKEAQVKMTL